MYIHRDSRHESEMSPHSQMQLRLWDLVPPAKYWTIADVKICLIRMLKILQFSHEWPTKE